MKDKERDFDKYVRMILRKKAQNTALLSPADANNANGTGRMSPNLHQLSAVSISK